MPSDWLKQKLIELGLMDPDPVQPVPSHYKKNIDSALDAYAKSHSQIPVYNRAQEAARDAAVCVGKQDWDGAITNLEWLKMHLDKGVEHWVGIAHEVDPKLLERYGSKLRE